MESELSGRVIADLKTWFEKALDRRRVVKDTSEQWYALGAVRPSSGESSPQYGVRISTVVEEGQLEYVPVAAPTRKIAGHSRHFSAPGKGKGKVSRSPVKLPRQFEVASPSTSSRKRVVTPLLLLPWHLSLLEEKDKKVGEIEELRLFSKEECRQCYCLFGLW